VIWIKREKERDELYINQNSIAVRVFHPRTPDMPRLVFPDRAIASKKSDSFGAVELRLVLETSECLFLWLQTLFLGTVFI
jgi:hypothetical protein